MNKLITFFFASLLYVILSINPSFSAEKYWVGGTGNLDGSTTTHISDTDGGAGGAVYPTSSDSLNFTNLSSTSNAAYTVTVTGTNNVLNFNMAGPGGGNKVTWAGNSALNIFGNLNLSGGTAGITRTFTGGITFSKTSSGATIDLGGGSPVTLQSTINISGAGGGWTLNSDVNNSNSNVTFSASGGSLDFNGKTFSNGIGSFAGSANTKTWTMGSSSITTGSWSINAADTFNANTSTININTTTVSFAGAGKTYNIVNLTATGSSTITGANNYATLSLNSGSGSTGQFSLSATQTVSGTLTVAGNNANTNRVFISSDTKGTQRTLSAGTIVSSNADYQDIVASGASSPWNLSSGIAGDCGNNSNITFSTPTTYYWKHGGTASVGMSTTANWYTATNGGGSAGRVPLPQDTAIFDSNSFSATGKTVTQDLPRVGAIDFSLATNSPTFTTSTAASFYGSLDVSASTLILTASTQTYTTENRSGTLTIKTGSGHTWDKNWTILSIGGTVTLADNFTTGSTRTFTVTNGTFTDGNFDFSTGLFSSSNSNTRVITMGSGQWTLTGSGNTIWNMATTTGLTFTRGSNPVIFNYSGSSGTRTINPSSMSESTAPSFSITAGSDIISINGSMYSLQFSGFTGSLANSARTVYGPAFTLSTGMTMTDNINATTFAATSGTQTITSNGVTWGGPISQTGSGGTVSFADNFTMPAGRTYTHTAGTIDFNSKTVSMGAYSSSNSNTRVLNNTGGAGTLDLTTTSTASAFDMATSTNATVSVTGLTIKFSGSTANIRTFAGGGKTFGKLLFVNATSGGTLTISGSNTFNNITMSVSNPQTLKFTAGTTTHVTTATLAGIASNLLTITSTNTSTFSIVKDTGSCAYITIDYANISHMAATPANTWYATNSTNSQATATAGSGVTFSASPSCSTGVILRWMFNPLNQDLLKYSIYRRKEHENNITNNRITA